MLQDITSVQRTASLASTVFSVLSVATGVHHTWQHRNKLDASHADAVRLLLSLSEFLLTRFQATLPTTQFGQLSR